MCGIAGILYADRTGRSTRRAEGDGRRDRPPRAGRRGLLDRAGRRPGAPPAVDHRPGRRRPADRQRGRLGPGRLQRRDLQLPGAAAPASKPAGTASAPTATPRSWSTSTRRTGDRLVERLRGMFAFALWDRHAAAAAAGPRPARHQAALRLPRRREAALRLRAQGDPGLSRRRPRGRSRRRWRTTSPSAWSPAPRSIFRGIEKLPPAHVLAVAADDLDRRPAPLLATAVRAGPRPTAEEWQEAIRAKLDETVRLHLIADVPVGAFLSGGVDSSVVVAVGRRADPGAAADLLDRLRARSRSASCPTPAQVAERFGTQHVEEIVTPGRRRRCSTS